MPQRLCSEAEFPLAASQKHWPCFTAEQVVSVSTCWIMTQVVRVCRHALTARVVTSAVLCFKYFSFPDRFKAVLEHL